jgi:hydroxyethylthiazole kinase-like uncharacterized protein yjeF
MKLVTAARMREIDRIHIVDRGIPADALMEAAGRAIARHFAEMMREPGRAVVLCGKGNNGGDGLVAARFLHSIGWKVEVLATSDSFTGEAQNARTLLPPAVHIRRAADFDDLVGWLRDFDGAIDALLGTGAKGPLREDFAGLVTALNDSGIFVLAADIPTGLDADTGEAPLAVHAHATVTIGRPKIGMVRGRGPEVTGRVIVEPIQFDPAILDGGDVRTAALLPDEVARLLPHRPHDGNKGTFGLCLVAAGSEAMPGAAVLATLGALRSGCGLVRAFAPGSVRAALAIHAPEALLPLPSDPLAAGHQPVDPTRWNALLHKTDSIVIGPGMSTATGARDLLYQVLEKGHVATVIDADALNMIADEDDLRALLDETHVLTPHPGELARLMSRSTSSIQEDRFVAAADAADRFGCTVVLKGHGTLVATPGGAITHIGTGNTALAKGGSGDLLSGLIGGLLAQGLAPESAAQLGAWVHGLAADVAAREHSTRGLLVRDIAEAIPRAFYEIEQHAN